MHLETRPRHERVQESPGQHQERVEGGAGVAATVGGALDLAVHEGHERLGTVHELHQEPDEDGDRGPEQGDRGVGDRQVDVALLHRRGHGGPPWPAHAMDGRHGVSRITGATVRLESGGVMGYKGCP